MKSWTMRLVGLVLTFLLCGTAELASAITGQEPQGQQPPAAQQQPPTDQQQQPAPQFEPTGSGNTNTTAAAKDNSTPLPDAPSANPSTPAQSNDSQQQGNGSTTPSGTAAAQVGRIKGGTASRPAGAAIAPAKQRQRRSLLIKMGLIAGAGVALGSVFALSHGSPARPPGAH